MRQLTALALVLVLLVSAVPVSLADNGVPVVLRSEARTLGATLRYASQTLQHPEAGRVEERILALPPGHGLTPVAVSGDALYLNPLTLADAAARLTAQGRTVVAGLNASFYDTSYYTPIGLLVEDGIVKSLDGGVTSLGFQPDGSVLIGKPDLRIRCETLSGHTFPVNQLNQVRSDSGLFLYTPDFGESTQTYRPGRHVVLTVENGARLRVGQPLLCTVKEVLNGTEAYKIGPDEIVLSATAAEPISRTDGLAVGDLLTVEVTAGDASWQDVVQGVGGLHMLVENGLVVPGLGTSSAPRSCVGLRPDGTAVFLAVDGRQSGYSAGLSLQQTARRMLELGCVTALELDGGGSTAMGISYPGKQGFEIVNRPSDGGLRRCRDFILFVNDRISTGIPTNLHLYGDTRVLAGSEASYTVLATDGAGHAVTPPQDAVLLAGGGAETAEAGQSVRFPAPGQATVLAYDPYTGCEGSLSVTVESALDTLRLINADGSAVPSKLFIRSGQTHALGLKGTRNGFSVAVSGNAAEWSVTGGAGVAEAGLFTATPQPVATGTLIVTAAGHSVELPISVGSGAALLADFEGDFPFTEQGWGLFAGPAPRRARAARGLGAAMLGYTFTGDMAELSQPLNLPLDGHPTALHLWLKGDGSAHIAFLRVLDSDGQWLDVPIGTLEHPEYRQVVVSLPPNAAHISGLILRKAGDEPLTGEFYLDHFVQSWSPEPDMSSPALTVLSEEPSGDAVVYRLQVTDNAGPPPSSRVSVTLDGQATLYSYNQSTGVVQFTAPAQTEGLRVYTVTASDSFGNYGRSQIRCEGSPRPQPEGGAEDIGDSWATETMRYLEARGLLLSLERDGRRVYEPKRSVTRLEIFEMLLLITGVAPLDYRDVLLPFVDLEGLSEDQLDVARAAYARGYVSGRTGADGPLLAAYGDLTRAELCTLLVLSSAQGLGAGDLTFGDATDIPAYAQDSVSRLAYNKLVSGIGDNRFLPNSTIDREQTAQLLLHLFV